MPISFLHGHHVFDLYHGSDALAVQQATGAWRLLPDRPPLTLLFKEKTGAMSRQGGVARITEAALPPELLALSPPACLCTWLRSVRPSMQ